MKTSRRLAWAALLPLWLVSFMTQGADYRPPSPVDFLPAGVLGMQLGSSWKTVKKSRWIKRLNCAPDSNHGAVFDQVCFFQSASRLAGAATHDGFIVRKGDRLVLIGTGIQIKNVDDPRAEAVMRVLQTQVHAKFQQDGDEVLFVDLPDQGLTTQVLDRFAEALPVLLVEVESQQTELSVLYGYLGPVNAFSALVDE
jgi:hypothetical protein